MENAPNINNNQWRQESNKTTAVAFLSPFNYQADTVTNY